MKTHDSPARALNPVAYAPLSVDGITIASREAGDPVDPKLIRRFYDEKVVSAS